MNQVPMVSSFNLMAGSNHSQESEGTYLPTAQLQQDENTNTMNINSS